MKTAQRVVWTEGMFVAPQHMQQQDIYHEERVAALLHEINPFSWGVAELHIDQDLLKTGSFVVQHCRAVLPGGVPVSFSARDATAPAQRRLEGHLRATQHCLEVFLGVAREREGVNNLDAEQGEGRFRSITRAVAELTSADLPAHSLQFAQLNLRVLLGPEASSDFDAIKIAEVTRGADGAYTLVESYIPPCLQVGASPYLKARLCDVLGTLASRRRTLVESCRQREAATAEFQSGDITGYLQLAAVNAMLPLVQYLIDVPSVPPQEAYKVLAQLAGQLASFNLQIEAAQLPKFRYTDLRATFAPLLQKILETLQATIARRYLRVELTPRVGGVLVGALQGAAVQQAGQFFLVVSSELPEEQVATQFPKLAKISNERQLRHVLQSATPGVPLRVTHRPPPEIPLRAGVVYFELDVSDAYWKSALSEGSVAIFVMPPLDVTRVRLELLAVVRAPAQPGAQL